MLNKIQITGTIEVVTGMHIGASEGFAAIGAIDSPVARDPITKLPYLPGSSLKGKIRSLLAKAYNEKPTKREDDDARIIRLFGSGKDKRNDNNPCSSRVIFSDSIMSNIDELRKLGVQTPTEAKEENTIDPITSIANPRQIERVVRGSKFPLSIIYNVEDLSTVKEDFETLREGLTFLEYDYIGGHGSRGYGRVKIADLKVNCVVGEVDEALLSECKKIMKED